MKRRRRRADWPCLKERKTSAEDQTIAGYSEERRRNLRRLLTWALC